MGYIGGEPDTNYTSFAQQTITGNGGTSYTLAHSVANGKEILLYINNIKQEEGSGKAYEATGTTLTLSESISSTDECYCVFLGKALQTTVPPDGSVSTAKIGANAVTAAKLATSLDLQNVTIKGGSTEAMTVNSSGVANIPKLNHAGYELIQSKMSTAHNGLAGGSVIEFRNVFSSAYISYKVIIGWYLHAGDSGENVEIRFMTGTNTQVSTANAYRYSINRTGDTDGHSVYKSSGATKGVIFTTIGGETNGANGGCHGELNIIGGTIGNTTLGGVSTQRYYSNDTTPVYAPIVYGTMCGISVSGGEYERQDSFVRLNSAQDPYHYTGFCFLTPSSGEAKGTHIAVYGMRSA